MKLIRLLSVLGVSLVLVGLVPASAMDSPPRSSKAKDLSLFSPERPRPKMFCPAGITPRTRASLNFSAVLGEGNFGKVYRASLDGQTVAVKVLTREFQPLKLSAEFRTQQQAGREHVAPRVIGDSYFCIPDYSEKGAALAFSMELIENAQTLESVFEEMNSLSISERNERIQALANQNFQKLSALHSKGISHRDLAPSNVLVASGLDRRPDVVYIIDYGVGTSSVGHAQYHVAEMLTAKAEDMDFVALTLIYLEALDQVDTSETQLTIDELIDVVDRLSELNDFRSLVLDRLQEIKRALVKRRG